jgi:Ni,Fe-hydrogenase III large subunit
LALRDVDRLAITGPSARAAGLAIDARTKDPAYSTIGFTPSVDKAGDAAARARVRAHELVASIDLARAAVGASFTAASVLPEAVEGPRGPVAVHVAAEGEPCAFVAQGADELLEAAAERLEGLEWAAAMAAIASFDLPGWKVAS